MKKYLASVFVVTFVLSVLLAVSLANATPHTISTAMTASVLATPSGSHQVSLACTPGAGGGQVTGFNFLRSTTKGGPYTQLSPGTSTTCSYSDTQSLVEGTTYYYVSQATGPGGVSGNSNEASATVPFLPPSIPSGLSAAAQ